MGKAIPGAEPAARRAATLKQARQLHLWLGTFFAPAILFFAFSGALQTFGLHEGRPGDAYQAPAWIAKMAQIHKKQTLETMQKGPPPGARRGDGVRPPAQKDQGRKPARAATLAFKIFTGLMAVGLMVTTFLGLYMTFQFARDKRVTWALLILGTVIPVALIALTG